MLTEKKLDVFLLKSGTIHGWLLLFNIVLRIAANAFRQEKEITGVKLGMEEVKLLLFIDNTLRKPWDLDDNN